MDYFVIKETYPDGLWFNVYVNGQCVDGFRDPSDAEMFGRWVSTGGSTRIESYLHDLPSEYIDPG